MTAQHLPATSGAASVPRSHFSSALFPVKDAFDVWSESVAPICRPVLAEEGHRHEFAAETEAFMLGDILLTHAATRGVGGYQGRGSSPWGAPFEAFIVQVYARGRCRGYAGGQAMEMGPGDVAVYDTMRPFEFSVGDSSLLTLAIPRPRVLEALGPSADPRATVIAGGTVPGAIVANAIASAWKTLPDSTAEDAAATGRMLLGAITGLMRAGNGEQDPNRPADTAVDAATLNALRAYIDRHIADPLLTPELLCRRFHCSRASLYRLFAPLGGIAHYVRRVRLERAYDELLVAGERETIIDIALRWGFGSLSNFGRLFREAFGATPSEIRERGRAVRLVRSGTGSSRKGSHLPLPEYRRWLETM